MKKLFSLLTICLFTISSFAYTNNVDSNSETKFEETKNEIIVKVTLNEEVKEFTFSYDSKEELYSADINLITKSIEKDLNFDSGEFCSVTISVTVRIGWDSNFVSATVSLEASCDTWKEELKRLRDEVRAILESE